MFTGIVQTAGHVASLEDHGKDRRAVIRAANLYLRAVGRGDSVCVSGVCLTTLAVRGDQFTADISAETLSRTTFSTLRAGDAVNLEKSLTPRTSLGGHFVMGHVDGVGTVADRRQAGRSMLFTIALPRELSKYIAEKGSICVDGVSLTINAVHDAVFEVNIIPHTLSCTTFGGLQVGDKVNLEVDIIARYLERLVQADEAEAASSGITEAFLARHGFVGDQ
ncbi:MAG: riboflavin synthase [Acidiferrobacterales bacterium]